MKPDMKVAGVRFHWDNDADAYEAQIGTDDIKDVVDLCAEAAEEYWNDAALQKAFSISEYIYATVEGK